MNKEKIKCGYIYPWKSPYNWKDNIKGIIRGIRDRYQRSKYGVAKMDCWDLDWYLLKVLKNGVIQYMEDTNGHPYNVTAEEWNNILARMTELIDILLKEDSDESNALFEKFLRTDEDEDRENWLRSCLEWQDYQTECRYELMDLLKEWGPHLWW